MELYPVINEKVFLVGKKPISVGVVTNIFYPNKDHSGRFIVHIHDKFREYDYEFWFSDYGVTVLNEIAYKNHYKKGSK